MGRIYGVGTDICDVRRIEAALERHGERFALKVLGPQAAQQLTQLRSVLQDHGQDSDQHPAVDWAWSSVERSAQP